MYERKLFERLRELEKRAVVEKEERFAKIREKLLRQNLLRGELDEAEMTLYNDDADDDYNEHVTGKKYFIVALSQNGRLAFATEYPKAMTGSEYDKIDWHSHVSYLRTLEWKPISKSARPSFLEQLTLPYDFLENAVIYRTLSKHENVYEVDICDKMYR